MALPKKLTEETRENLLDRHYELELETFQQAILVDDTVKALNLTADQKTELVNDMTGRYEARSLSEFVTPIRNNAKRIITDQTGQAIDIDKFIARYAASDDDIQDVEKELREVDSAALAAVKEGDYNSLGRKLLESEDLSNRFENLINKQVEIRKSEYAEEYKDFFGQDFKELDPVHQAAHVALLSEQVRASYYAPVYLGLEKAPAKGKYSIDAILNSDTTTKSVAGLVNNIQDASLSVGLSEIKDLAGFGGLFQQMAKAASPTQRLDLKKLAGEDVEDEVLDKAISQMQKYGVSTIIDPNIPRMELASQTANAIANLRTRSNFTTELEAEMALEGLSGETQIPEQVVRDLNYIRNQEMDSVVAGKRQRQYEQIRAEQYRLDQSIQQKSSEELEDPSMLQALIQEQITLGIAKEHVTMSGPLTEDTLVDKPRSSSIDQYLNKTFSELSQSLARNPNLTDEQLVSVIQNIYDQLDSEKLDMIGSDQDPFTETEIAFDPRKAGDVLSYMFEDQVDVQVERTGLVSGELLRLPIVENLVDLTESELDITLRAQLNALRIEIGNAERNGKDTEELVEKLKRLEALEGVLPKLSREDVSLPAGTGSLPITDKGSFRDKLSLLSVALEATSDENYSELLNNFFPGADTSLIAQAYPKDEFRILINDLNKMSMYTNEAADLMSGEPNAGWDSVRKNPEFQDNLQAQNLNGAIEQFGNMNLYDLPRYLADLADVSAIDPKDLSKPITVLYEQSKAAGSPLFDINDLIFADEYRNDVSSHRAIMTGIMDVLTSLTTRTEYDMEEEVVVVRPSTSTMSVMNTLGMAKEYLELVDPDSYVTQLAMFTFAPFTYTLDYDRLIEAVAPETRMQGLVFGGVQEDIRQNMRNTRRDLSVEEIDRIVADVSAFMSSNGIVEFASDEALNQYTQQVYQLDADQIFDGHSRRLLLGHDRFANTIMGVPIKPTFIVPHSIQESMLADNGKYVPMFDYERTTFFDRSLAMLTVGQEGAMGFSRFRAERMGYSPLTPGYVKAQGVGLASDILVDPIDPIFAGTSKALDIGATAVRRAGGLKSGLKPRQLVNFALLEAATNDGLTGVVGRAFSNRIQKDAFQEVLDAQIRRSIQEELDTFKVSKESAIRATKDVTGRALAVGSLSLLIGGEAMAEVISQRGLSSLAVGTARGGLTQLTTDTAATNQLQMGFAKALKDTVGYQDYYNYVVGKAYLGSSRNLNLLTPEIMSVPAEQMVRLYYHEDLKDTINSGESLFAKDDANRNTKLAYHTPFFNKLGIDINLVVSILDTQAAKQHPQMLKGLQQLNDGPIVKEFENASKRHGFDKFFDDFDLDKNQKKLMYRLFAAHIGDQDVDAFVRSLVVETSGRSKKVNIQQQALETIRASREQDPVYNEATWNTMSKPEQDYMYHLGIQYGDDVTLESVEQAINNRLATQVKYVETDGAKTYQMLMQHEGQAYRADVRVSVKDNALRIDDIEIIRDSEQKAMFEAGDALEPPEELIVQSLIRHLAETDADFDTLIVRKPEKATKESFIAQYTRPLNISDDTVKAVDDGYSLSLKVPKRTVSRLQLASRPIVSELKPLLKQPFVTEGMLRQTQDNIGQLANQLVEAERRLTSSLSPEELAQIDGRRIRGSKDEDIIMDYYGSPKRQAVEDYLGIQYDKETKQYNKKEISAKDKPKRRDFSQAYIDAYEEVERIRTNAQLARSTYASLGGDPKSLERPTVLETDQIDQELQKALNEERQSLAAEDITTILNEQEKARFFHVREDGTHIFKGPADGNIQVRFFEDANGQQVMTVEKIGMANVNDVVSLLKGQLDSSDQLQAKKATDQLYSKLEEQESFQKLNDMLSNEYRNLTALLQYAIDEGVSIAYPSRLDGSVGNVILNELAYRVGVDQFQSKVETLVTHNNIIYRSIDMDPMSAAKRTRKSVTPQDDLRIVGDEFGRAQKVLQAETPDPEDLNILNKWIGENTDPKVYLTTTRVNADITMMGMNRTQVQAHVNDLMLEQTKLQEALNKYGMDVQDEIDANTRALEAMRIVSEKQPDSSIVVQTSDNALHKIPYTHNVETDTLVFDVSSVDERYAEVVTNAVVRHASSYSNISGVDFVMQGQLDATPFIEVKDSIFGRWGVTDNIISEDMKDSVPSRGALFAPRTPHGSLKKLGKYASNLSYKHVDARDARVASDLVGKTNDGNDPLASIQLSNRIEGGRQIGAVFYGKDTSYDEALFAIHDQPLQHIIVTDVDGPIQKSDVTLVEKYYTKKQAGTALRGPVARRDVRAESILERGEEQLEVVWTKEKGYLIEPRNQYGRSFDVNMETIGNRIKTAKAPVIAINAPYGYMDAITPLRSLLAEINKTVDAGGVDLNKTVQIDIIQPSGITRIQTTLQKLLTDDPANLAAQTVKNKINELSIKFRNEKYFVVDKFIISDAQKIYNDQSMEMISSIFESLSSNETKAQQWTNIGLDDVKNTVATKHGFEPVLYTDRTFSGDVPEPNLAGTYSIDFIHRTDIKQSPFLRDDGIFKRRRYLKGGYKYGYEAIPYGQYEQAKQVDGGFYIRTSDGLEVDTSLFDKARIQEPAADETTRIRYSTQMMGRRYYNDGYSGMSPVLTNVFRPFRDYALDMTKRNIVSDDELLTLIFGDVNNPGRTKNQDDALLDLMQVLSATMRDNLNRMINGDLKPSDIFNAYLSAVYSQQVGKIDRRTLKKKMTEMFRQDGKFGEKRVLLTVLADELFADVVKEAGLQGLEQAYKELGLDMKQSVILDTFKQNASFFDDDNVFIKTESLPQMWSNYTVEGLAFMQELDEKIMSGVFIDDIKDMQSLNQALMTPYNLREMFGRSNVKEPRGKFWYQQTYKLYWETQEISKQLRSKKGPITQEDLKEAMDKLYKTANRLQGLGNVKTPFMLSLLGLGHKTTMDSRQVNALFGSFMADPATKKSTTRPVAKTADSDAVENLRYKRMFEGLLVYEELFDANERLAPFTERLPKIGGVDPLNELLERRMEAFLPSFAAVLRSRYDASAIEGIIDPTVLPYVAHQLIWGRISDMLPHEIAQLELHLTLGVKPESGQLMRQVLELLTDSPYSPDLLRWIQRNVMDQIETGFFHVKDIEHFIDALQRSPLGQMPELGLVNQAIESYFKLYKETGGDLNSYQFTRKLINESIQGTGPRRNPLDLIPYRLFDDLKNGRSFFRMEDGKPFIFLDDKATLHTFLHENGHLLETLLGDKHYQNVAKHLDHVVRSDGRLMLTRRGQEQFAEFISNMVLEGDAVPAAFESARPFLAKQVSKLSTHFAKLLGFQNDQLKLAARSGIVKKPRYRIKNTEGIQSVIQELIVDVAKKGNDLERQALGDPISAVPEVKQKADAAKREQATDVSGAQIKEFVKSKGLTQADVLRELLPSRWEAFKSFEDAEKADEAFLKVAREQGIDVIDAARKFEANRISEWFASTSAMTRNPLVAVTAQSVVPRNMVTNIARRTRARLEQVLGKSMDELQKFVKVETETAYHNAFNNQLDIESMPYIDLDEAGVDVGQLQGFVSRLENGPMRTYISERLKSDLAGSSNHKLYLHELQGLRDGIIDNAIPTARARSRKLENAPTNIATATKSFFMQADKKSLMASISDGLRRLSDLIIPVDELEAKVTPEFYDVLQNIKNRTKGVENKFKAMFEEARNKLGRASQRTIISIMQEMRRMLNPPLSISDVSLVMELSRNFNEFIDTVNTDDTVNTLYTKTLTQDTIDNIVNLLDLEQREALSFQIQQLKDYVALRSRNEAHTGRLAVIAEDAVMDIYKAMNTKHKSNFKAFFVQSYIGENSSILNQIEAMLLSQQTLLTHPDELQTVRDLRAFTKQDLANLENRKRLELMIVDLFEIVQRRKRLVERRGGKILESLGVSPNNISSDVAASAYTFFYTGRFSVHDYDIAQMNFPKEGLYRADAPPDGYAWKASDINDIAIQFGYISNSQTGRVQLRNAELQEVFNVIGIKHKVSKLDQLDPGELAHIANQIATGTSKQIKVRETLFSLAMRLGSDKTLQIVPTTPTRDGVQMLPPKQQTDATGVYFEMFTRMLAEDIHLGAAEELYAVYSEGNLQKLIAQRQDIFDIDPITEMSVIKQEVIEEVAKLLSSGDVKLRYKAETRFPSKREQQVRNIAKQVIDAAGFTIRQTQATTKEINLPDGSRLLVHEEVENQFNNLMSTFAPVGVAIRKDEPVDSFIQMTRRQFGELDRLMRKANAADEITTYMTSKPMTNYLSKKTVDAFIKSDGDFNVITDDQKIKTIFNRLYSDTLHVNEAVGYFMFKNNISSQADLTTEQMRSILSNTYQDANFVKNNVSIDDYKAFLESPTGILFSQKTSQFMSATINMISLYFTNLLRAPIELLRTFKQSVTSGYLLPNARYFFGNFIGGISQLLIGRGAEGVLSVFGAITRHPQFYAEVMYDLTFGKRSQDARPKVMVTSDGMMYTPNMLTNMMTENSVGSSMVTAELGRQLQADLVGSEMWRTSTLSKSTLGPIRAISNLNSKVFLGAAEALDNIYRVGLFMEQLDSGMSPSVAAKEVRRVMFDYADLTEVEKKYLRNTFTFYSFMRKNTGLILSELVTNPSRVIGQMRLIRQSVRSNIEEGYAEYGANEFYHSRLALMPGTPIYNLLRSDSGGFTLTSDGLIRNSRIEEKVLLLIKNAKLALEPNPFIVQMAEENDVDFDGLMQLFIERRMTDLDVAKVLGFVTPDGTAIDMQRFVDEFDLVQHTEDQVYTFEMYSDVYQDKMYIFPALNAPDGFGSLLGIFNVITSTEPEGFQFFLNQLSPLVQIPLTGAFSMSTFGMRPLQRMRVLPAQLVENPLASFMFQDADQVSQETWSEGFPKVRIRPVSNQERSDLTRMHKFGDSMYAFDSDQEAMKFVLYSTLLAAHPLMGRSEQQSLQILDALSTGEFYKPPGMTLEEYAADLMGLRSVPITTYDEQIQKAYYIMNERIQAFDTGYVQTDFKDPPSSEITLPSRVREAEIKAETKEKLREQ